MCKPFYLEQLVQQKEEVTQTRHCNATGLVLKLQLTLLSLFLSFIVGEGLLVIVSVFQLQSSLYTYPNGALVCIIIYMCITQPSHDLCMSHLQYSSER